MTIDMRREFVGWQKDHGHWAVVRCAVLTRRCGCVDRQTGQIRGNCKSCLGTGHHYVDYIVKTDKRTEVPDVEADIEIGDAQQIGTGILTFYFERHIPCKRDDFVLEVELLESGLPVTPFVIREAYKIFQLEDLRDKLGRVEFFQARVDRVTAR